MRGKRKKILTSGHSRVRTTSPPDYVLLGIVGLLVGAGLLTLFSASALYGTERFGSAYFFLKRQVLLGVGPGILLGALFYVIPLNIIKKASPLFFTAAVVASALTLAPSLGVTIGGASRWLALGPLQFQPSEFLKIAYILYVSALLSSRSPVSIKGAKGARANKEKEREGKKESTLKPFLIVSGIGALVLFLQPDAGTLALILSVGAVIYFVSGASLLTIALVGILLVFTAAALAYTAPYRFERLLVFLNPKTDPLGVGYQINQILIAIGSGGLYGLGMGMSQQKFGFIPQPIGDSIFAIFAEEFGFIGSILLTFLFVVFVWRGLQIARQASDSFSRLVAAGMVAWVGIQSFINLSAMVGLLPLTGIPLPFFSYGGSAMASLLAGIGVLLHISRHSA